MLPARCSQGAKVSFTETHGVTLTLTCPACRQSIGSDDVRPEWVEAFRAAHTHGGAVRFVCLPCQEAMHDGCQRSFCECPCQKEGGRVA